MRGGSSGNFAETGLGGPTTMTKEQALSEIKTLRDKINNQGVDAATDASLPEADTWINSVCFHLDAAADAIEFPKKVA